MRLLRPRLLAQNELLSTSVTDLGTQLIVSLVEPLAKATYLPGCPEWEYWEAVANEFSELTLTRVDTNGSEAQLSFKNASIKSNS